MIKAIIFDFGNVLYTFNNDLFLRELVDYSELSLHEIEETIYHSGLPDQYERGEITSEECFSTIAQRCRISISLDRMRAAFISIFTPIEGTLKLIEQLQSRYKLGLLSNTNEWHFEYFMRKCRVYPCFDSVTLSYEVGEMKPGGKIYSDALTKLDLQPHECVYIDDIAEYTEAASQLGITGIHYTSHFNLIRDLEELGIHILPQ